MPHQAASREEWLAARLGLLKEEKELTRKSGEPARRPQEKRGEGPAAEMAGARGRA